jgi:hypothetical protein
MAPTNPVFFPAIVRADPVRHGRYGLRRGTAARVVEMCPARTVLARVKLTTAFRASLGSRSFTTTRRPSPDR